VIFESNESGMNTRHWCSIFELIMCRKIVSWYWVAQGLVAAEQLLDFPKPNLLSLFALVMLETFRWT